MNKEPFKSLREHIKDQVLNYATMTDLVYHQRLISYIQQNPPVDPNAVREMRLNQCSSLEEKKEYDTPGGP